MVVGVDIAKEEHFARAFNFRRLELDRVVSFSNTLDGFDSFKRWIDRVMRDNNLDKIIIGFEPTGHYWYNFAEYCRSKDFKYVMVNPFHGKRIPTMYLHFYVELGYVGVELPEQNVKI